MLSRDIIAVSLATFYLLIYIILLQFDATIRAGFTMLLFSPFIICWMVYAVLRHGRFYGKELNDREFGYQDKEYFDLDTF